MLHLLKRSLSAPDPALGLTALELSKMGRANGPSQETAAVQEQYARFSVIYLRGPDLFYLYTAAPLMWATKQERSPYHDDWRAHLGAPRWILDFAALRYQSFEHALAVGGIASDPGYPETYTIVFYDGGGGWSLRRTAHPPAGMRIRQPE